MRILFLCIIFVCSLSTAIAGTAQLTWDAPITYTDGTPLPLSDISAYTIYYGISPTAIMSSRNVLNITIAWPSLSTMNYTVNNLGAGTWYFAVSCTVGTSESGLSNIIRKVIVLTPNPPSNLIIPGGVTYV